MCGLRASAGLGQFETELGDACESEVKVTVFWVLWGKCDAS